MNSFQITFADYSKEIDSLIKGIKYCQERISSETTEKWEKKEYAAVMADDYKRIDLIKQTMVNCLALDLGTEEQRLIKIVQEQILVFELSEFFVFPLEN